MAERIARGWLAILLAKLAIHHRRTYAGRHRNGHPREGVSQTYHPDHSGIFSILDSPHRYHELWLARFDGRDESMYLSASLMRAPVVETVADPKSGAIHWTKNFEALWTVVDYLKAERMSNWGWLRYSTDEFPTIWKKEMEIRSGQSLFAA